MTELGSGLVFIKARYLMSSIPKDFMSTSVMSCDNNLTLGQERHIGRGVWVYLTFYVIDAVNSLFNIHVDYYFAIDMVVDCKIAVDTTIESKR